MIYNEKIRWLMRNDHENAKAIAECIDKIKVHDFCKRRLGVDICTPIYKIYDNADQITFDDLPKSFVLKTNNNCGANIFICNKKNARLDIVKERVQGWLDDQTRKNASVYHALIEPRCFAEKYLANSMTDYKLYCFGGKMHFMLIKQKVGDKLVYNYYDKDFNFIENVNILEDKDVLFEKPINYYDMVAIAEILSKPFRYVRVDLYNIGGKIYLGEMTFTEAAGYNPYLTKYINEKWKDLIQL